MTGAVNVGLEPELSLELRTSIGGIVAVTALIDTGFTDYLLLPSALVRELQAPETGQELVELADGSVLAVRVCEVTLRWMGGWLTVPTLVADGDALIGMRLLAGYRLEILVVPSGEVQIGSR